MIKLECQKYKQKMHKQLDQMLNTHRKEYQQFRKQFI